MTDMLQRFGRVLRRWMARSIETPSRYARSAWTASLSLAETLLELVNSKLLPDITRIKEANISAIEAEADKKKAEAQCKDAEAQLKLAEAVDAANRAALHKRQDAMARAEKARLAAEAAKTDAEARAIEKDADTRRLAAIAEAKARLLEAVSQLRQDGGELFVNQENLERIIQVELPRLERDAAPDSGVD